MRKPQNTLYPSFSSSIENKTNVAASYIKEAKKTLRREWRKPLGSTATSSLDVATIKDKFDRGDIQSAYADYLKGDENSPPPIEATTIKFQNGFIAADEQAYRIRHYSLPRALVAGYFDDKRWANGLMQDILTDRIKKTQELAAQDFESKYNNDED